jgi:hypothetical protein
LGLLGKERLALDGWRRRPALVPGTPDLEVKDDPTANESSIAPLETESGLTWAEAGSRSMPI